MCFEFQEEERSGFSDGTFHNQRYFTCNARRALFVNINQCQKDGRFQEPPQGANSDAKSKSKILYYCVLSVHILM